MIRVYVPLYIECRTMSILKSIRLSFTHRQIHEEGCQKFASGDRMRVKMLI